MITVAILINGNPLTARSATNTLAKSPDGKTIYRVDDGSTIEHDRKDGAVALAKLMLDTIRVERGSDRDER